MEAQHMFFVATAPLSPDGFVNLSPKGLAGTLAVLDEQSVAYLDLTGCGVETIAHAKENGRICLMFCAFDGRPRIVRIHGHAKVIERGDSEFGEALSRFPEYDGVRSIIRVRASRISESCGFSVPLYDFQAQREQITKWAARKEEDGIRGYQLERNARSLDGLPGGPN